MQPLTLFLTGSLVILGLVACTSERPLARTMPSHSTSPSATNDQSERMDRRGVLGETLESDLGLFTLNAVDFPIRTRDVSARDGFEIAAAHYTICSNGVRSRSVSPGDFALSRNGDGGPLISRFYLLGARLPSLAERLRGALPADHCVTGWLSFEVPVGADLAWVYFVADDVYQPFRDYRGVSWDLRE